MIESSPFALARPRAALDNLGRPPSLPKVLGALTPGGLAYDAIAGQFTTGETRYLQLISATVRLQNPETAIGVLTATYQASLWSDRDSLPGLPVWIFDTYPALPAGSGPADVCFASGAGIALEANTRYWLAIRNITGRQLSWVTTRSATASSRLRGWRMAKYALAQRHRGGPWEAAGDGRALQFSITVANVKGSVLTIDTTRLGAQKLRTSATS